MGGAPRAAAVEAVALGRDFGAVTAVDRVDFALAPGELLAVFGPNGAGKTSLLRMLAGALRPTRGEVRIGGTPLDYAVPDWRARIGVLSHQTFLYGHLSARENLRFYGRLYGLDDLALRVPERLERVGLTARADDRVGTYSRGMRQRLALARTLLHDPDVVLLDEPYTGLDVHAADLLRDVLRALREGPRAVVLVTHHLGQGLELADRVAIQVAGGFRWTGGRSEVDAATFGRFYRDVVEGGEARPGGPEPPVGSAAPGDAPP